MNIIKNSLVIIFCICTHVNKTYTADTTPQFTDTPTANDCLPAINQVNAVNLSKEQELACLKAGHKKIWWGSSVDNESEWTNENFGILKYNKFNNNLQIIIYAKDPIQITRTALLFEKYLLDQELSGYTTWIDKTISRSLDAYFNSILKDNAYAIGSFLGYEKDTIDYYYKYSAFRLSNLTLNPKNKQRKIINTKIITQSPHTLAKEINLWATQYTEWQEQFNKDKAMYEKWIEINKNISNEKLKEQNRAINNVIAALNNDAFLTIKNTQPKGITPTLAALKKSQSWWQTFTKYAASFALGTAAYALFSKTKSP